MIRPYQPADLDALLDTWYQASKVAHPFLSEDFLKGERRAIEDVYMSLAETWIYEDDGRLRGFIARVGREVGALFVHPDHHRRGIGRALMDHLHAKHADLKVEVFEANQLGRAFYDAYGFRLAGRRKHTATSQTMLLMRLTRESDQRSDAPDG